MISMLFKCKDGFVLREDKIHYIKANKDGYALVYMRYAQEQPYAITLEDYALLVTVLLKDYEYQKFYMTSNGDVFSLNNANLCAGVRVSFPFFIQFLSERGGQPPT